MCRVESPRRAGSRLKAVKYGVSVATAKNHGISSRAKPVHTAPAALWVGASIRFSVSPSRFEQTAGHVDFSLSRPSLFGGPLWKNAQPSAVCGFVPLRGDCRAEFPYWHFSCCTTEDSASASAAPRRRQRAHESYIDFAHGCL